MALLASKSQYPHNPPPSAVPYYPPGSPTNSEFSDSFNNVDDVKYGMLDASLLESKLMTVSRRFWDEHRVGEWLTSINCGSYEQLFKSRSCTLHTWQELLLIRAQRTISPVT